MLTDDTLALIHATYEESREMNDLMRDDEAVGAYFGAARLRAVRRHYLIATGQPQEEEQQVDEAAHHQPVYMQVDDFETI